MKKMIFMGLVLAAVLGCKKQNVEPVIQDETTHATNHLPKMVIHDSTSVFFSYYENGLVSKVVKTINQDTVYVTEYQYQGDYISYRKTRSKYFHFTFQEYTPFKIVEEFISYGIAYDLPRIITCRTKTTEDDTTISDMNYVYHYTPDVNVDYIMLTGLGANEDTLNDSISVDYDEGTKRYDIRRYYDKGQEIIAEGDSSRTELNGYRDYDYYGVKIHNSNSSFSVSYGPSPIRTSGYMEKRTGLQFEVAKEFLKTLDVEYPYEGIVQHSRPNKLVGQNSIYRYVTKDEYEYEYNSVGQLIKVHNDVTNVFSGSEQTNRQTKNIYY
jgi:hypothetical protein